MRFRKTIISVIIIIFSVALIFLSINTIKGDNITFQSVYTTISARLAFNAIRNGNYEGSTRYIGFYGFNEDRSDLSEDNIVEEKQRFVSGLEQIFADENIVLDSIQNINISTDDRFTKGTVELYISEGEALYKIKIMVALQSGKVCPMSIYSIEANEEDYNQAAIFSEKFIEVIRTYYPG